MKKILRYDNVPRYMTIDTVVEGLDKNLIQSLGYAEHQVSYCEKGIRHVYELDIRNKRYHHVESYKI